MNLRKKQEGKMERIEEGLAKRSTPLEWFEEQKEMESADKTGEKDGNK